MRNKAKPMPTFLESKGPFRIMEKLRPLSLSDLQDLTLVPLKEGELVNLIQEESRAFTIDRKNIHQYVENEKKVSAYALFYLPTNMPKLYFLLDEVVKLHGEKILSNFSKRIFVDVGAGPGTFSLALLFYLKEKGLSYPAIHLIDQSALMLKQAEKILKHFFPEVKVTIGNTEKFVTSENSSYVLFFGHSLNEFSEDITKRYWNLIAENKNISDVFWIEPGTPSFFQKQLALRKKMVEEKFSILYPCAQNTNCPLEGKTDGENPEWCHQILRLTHAPEIERVSQLMALDRKILPMCGMYFSRAEKETKNEWVFPLKFLNETKFSFDYLFCGTFVGESLSHKKGEILKKFLSKKAIKTLKDRSLGYPLKKNNQDDFKYVSDFFRVNNEALLEDYVKERENNE